VRPENDRAVVNVVVNVAFTFRAGGMVELQRCAMFIVLFKQKINLIVKLD
jgi:hypothetical protein